MNYESNSLDLRKVIVLGFRDVRLLVLAATISVICAAVFSAVVQPIYEVKFTVKIGQFDRDRPLEDINVMFESLKRQYNVKSAGIRAMEAPAITAIERLDDKRVLSVVVSGPEPQATLDAAENFASAITGLHAQKHATIKQAAARQVAALEYVEQGLQNLSSENLPQTAELFLFDRLGDVGNKYLTAYQNYAEINAEPTRVIQMDDLPSNPTRPNWTLNLALAVVVGLMLGVGINLIRAE